MGRGQGGGGPQGHPGLICAACDSNQDAAGAEGVARHTSQRLAPCRRLLPTGSQAARGAAVAGRQGEGRTRSSAGLAVCTALTSRLRAYVAKHESATVCLGGWQVAALRITMTGGNENKNPRLDATPSSRTTQLQPAAAATLACSARPAQYPHARARGPPRIKYKGMAGCPPAREGCACVGAQPAAPGRPAQLSLNPPTQPPTPGL